MHVCGVDHSEVMLRRARERNAEVCAPGDVDLKLASLNALPTFIRGRMP
jgi:hypothetical protein